MKTRLGLTYAFNLLDLAITYILFLAFGIGIEANPLGVTLLQSPVFLLLYKVVFVGGCLILLWVFRNRKSAQIAVWAVFLVYALLTAYHLTGIVLLLLV